MPESGGWLNQPAGLLDKMSVVGAAYKAIKEFYAAPNLAKWSNANPGAMQTATAIINMEIEDDGTE